MPTVSSRVGLRLGRARELGCRGWGRANDGALWPPVLPSTATRTSSQVTFPIDFFEHNQQLTDVEFGGNDLLQVYNAQQIKHRLNSTGMYVANTKVRTGCSALGSVPGQQGSRTYDVRSTSPVGVQGSQSLALDCSLMVPRINRYSQLHAEGLLLPC